MTDQKRMLSIIFDNILLQVNTLMNIIKLSDDIKNSINFEKIKELILQSKGDFDFNDSDYKIIVYFYNLYMEYKKKCLCLHKNKIRECNIYNIKSFDDYIIYNYWYGSIARVYYSKESNTDILKLYFTIFMKIFKNCMTQLNITHINEMDPSTVKNNYINIYNELKQMYDKEFNALYNKDKDNNVDFLITYHYKVLEYVSANIDKYLEDNIKTVKDIANVDKHI